MNEYDRKAAALQDMTRDSEGEKLYAFSAEEAQAAQVRTREDLVLVVSHISSVNEQLRSLRGLLILLIILLSLVLWRAW